MSRSSGLSGCVVAAAIVVALSAALGFTDAATVEDRAGECLAKIAVDRGICVLLADEPAELATAMAARSELIFYLQTADRDAAARAREALDAGLLGTRVYVETGDWSHLHLATGLADAAIVSPEVVQRGDVSEAELLRVVRPLGIVLLGDRLIEKPYPAEADDWTHAYHGPDNNPQSTDRLARAPYLTQFLAEPYYVPFPEVTVTARGRIFKAFGHVGYKRRDWPWLNKLVALNGYNGTLLWKRSLEAGFNIHRNTMVATPDVLYVADSRSCKLLAPATGELLDEITAPDGATGPVWKWMAVQDGVLYALVGREEFRDPTLKGNRTAAGWPWRPMTEGYDATDYPWGFGRTLLAVDLDTKKVRWMHREEEPIDGRAVAMKGGRIYYYSDGKHLGCLDAASGKPLWRNDDARLLEAIGPTEHAQSPRLGFSSSAYMKCSPEAIYLAGPQRSRLVAASAEDGHLLWQYPYGNFQLVLRDEGLYAMGRTGPSKLFGPTTGEVLADLDSLRGNCTRVTGSVDSIFGRGHDHAGTLRLTVPGHEARRIALMRPDCHGGVIAAGGLVYWGPWMCDCSLSLVGNIALGPAGDFDFAAEAIEAERLESTALPTKPPRKLEVRPGDWPAYRANNRRSSASQAKIPSKVGLAWQYRPPDGVDSTAPVTAGGLVFIGGSDGVVRALDAAGGACRWKSYTAGPIQYPPAIDDGRLLVGSGDGWVYALDAASGEQLWRFRAAPAERKISVYGRLTSTWPVASGVLVDDGVVYAAAGIASYDGTHVYALDSATGSIRWQNNTSGHLLGGDRTTGVSVQGHLLLNAGRLYMAGGNVVSPAVYDAKTGRCLNTLVDEWGGQRAPPDELWKDPVKLREFDVAQKKLGKSPRGCELFLVNGEVTAFDRLLYSPKEYWVGRYFADQLVQAGSPEAVIWAAVDRIARAQRGSNPVARPKAMWDVEGFGLPVAMAVGRNAVVVAGIVGGEEAQKSTHVLTTRSLDDGSLLWQESLPAAPAWWSLVTDSAGRVVTTLADGRVLCFEGSE